MMTRKKIGELLVESGVISTAQLHAALEWQRANRVRLGSALVELGFASEEQVLSALARRLGLERLHLDTLPPSAASRAAARLVPEELASAHGVVPVAADDRTLTVALRDPTDLSIVDELAFITGRRVRVVVAGEREIWRATSRTYLGRCELELDTDGVPVRSDGSLVSLADSSFY